MKKILAMCLFLYEALSFSVYADTIDHYMKIVDSIPKMAMKADPESQAWARSARNILMLTSESVGESLTLANESASRQGTPLFCLPPAVKLNGVMLNELIQQTYHEISSQQSDKDSMTVSQVALTGLIKLYPCMQHAAHRRTHVNIRLPGQSTNTQTFPH